MIDPRKSFWQGMGLSALVSFALAVLFLVLVELAVPSDEYHLIEWVGGIGSVIVFVVGTHGFTNWGMFKIALGKKGLREWLKAPTGEEYGPGIGWTLPLLSSVKEVDTQAGLTSLGVRKYTINNGFDIHIDAELTWQVEDTIAFQNIRPDQVANYVETQFEGSTREVIIDLPVNFSHEDFENLKAGNGGALEVTKEIALFKGATKAEGAKNILNRLKGLDNNGAPLPEGTVGLSLYGIKPIQVKIKDATFSADIEQTVERILKEIYEKPGMMADAKNKAEVIKILRENAGIDFDKLTPTEKAEFESKLIDSALALEGKATVTRINFGGSPPPGTIFNPRP